MQPVFKSPTSYQPQKVICALDSGSSGPGSSPGRGHCVVLLFTHVYKWVTANMLGIIMRCTSIPSRGEYSLPLHAKETGVKVPAPWAIWACIKALLLLFNQDRDINGFEIQTIKMPGNKIKWNFEPLINESHLERGLMGGVMLIVRK